MTTAKELGEWIATLSPDTQLAVDDGGLTIVEVNNERDIYFEIGGTPDEDDLCECGREQEDCATFDGEEEHDDR